MLTTSKERVNYVHANLNIEIGAYVF